MKKTLVAVAALAAVTGAMAEVSITGHLDQAYTSVSGSSAGVTNTTYNGLSSLDAPSFIVFAGSEDLGGGLKASFHVENGLAMNSSSLLSDVGANGTWNEGKSGTNRETWVALSGEFGDVKLGLQYAPVFFTVLANDPGGLNNAPGVLSFAATSAGAINNLNAVTYTSPSMNGITFSAQSQSGTANGATASTNAGNGFGYSLTYTAGGLNASVAYNSQAADNAATTFYGGNSTPFSGTSRAVTVTTTAGDATTNTAIGANYNIKDVAKISYLNTQSALNSYSSNYNLFGITVPFGAASVAYSYSSGNYSATSSTTRNQNGQQLIAYYNFSAHTKAYLVYGIAKDTTNNDSTSATGLGIAHSF